MEDNSGRRSRWEAWMGENVNVGMVRLLAAIAAFGLVFGTMFWALGRASLH